MTSNEINGGALNENDLHGHLLRDVKVAEKNGEEEERNRPKKITDDR